MLPVEILREVFGDPTQYGTPYHALCNAVLARGAAGERKSSRSTASTDTPTPTGATAYPTALRTRTRSPGGGCTAECRRPSAAGRAQGNPSPKPALDLAVHDLWARAAGMSLRTFLGGDERASVELSYTLTGHDAAAVGEEVAAAREAGFRHFNFKTALASGDDPEVARAVREAAGPEAFVWADANQGYNLHQAREAGRRLAAAGVDVLEQPLPAALNGSQFTDESALFPTKTDVESGGTVYLPDAPGIGVRPDEEALRDLDRGR